MLKHTSSTHFGYKSFEYYQ